MPIYEYACEACGHRFERWQNISEGPVTECPACQAARVQKLISRSSFALKGSGWYATDYKSSSSSTDDKKSA